MILSDYIYNNKSLCDNIKRFKEWNIGTIFYPSFNDIDGKSYIRATYKNMGHDLIWNNGFLFPYGFHIKYEILNTFLLTNKKNIIRQIKSKNFEKIDLILNQICEIIIESDTDYNSNQYQDLDMLFYLCLTAEFYKQVEHDNKLKCILIDKKFTTNYLVSSFTKFI